jgi:hypothetical protein
MKNPKYQVFKGKDDQFYFRLVAANGEKVLASEGYVSKAGCKNGINSVKANSLLSQRYARKTSDNGECFFTVVAANRETIGVSETYTTEHSRDEGIEVIKKIASSAPVEDIS